VSATRPPRFLLLSRLGRAVFRDGGGAPPGPGADRDVIPVRTGRSARTSQATGGGRSAAWPAWITSLPSATSRPSRGRGDPRPWPPSCWSWSPCSERCRSTGGWQRRGPYGEGSLAMLERIGSWWTGKILVLVLLGFAATDFLITMTLAAADTSTPAGPRPPPNYSCVVTGLLCPARVV